MSTSRNHPLIHAVRSRDIESTKALLAAGVNPNLQDEKGDTALMWAAYDGSTECVHLLLAAGANFLLQNKNGNTALIEATEFGKVDCIEALLSIKDKSVLEIENKESFTALDNAINGKLYFTSIALLNHGAKIRKPKKLYDFLTETHQFTHGIFVISSRLYEHQTKLRAIERKNPLLLNEEEFQFIELVEKIHALHKKNINQTIDEAIGTQLPVVLLDLIYQYNTSTKLDHDLSFFGKNNGGIYLEREKEIAKSFVKTL